MPYTGISAVKCTQENIKCLFLNSGTKHCINPFKGFKNYANVGDHFKIFRLL